MNILEYKGYVTKIEYSAEDKVLHGKIEGIVDLVTFEAVSASDIEKEFQYAVDDYINDCLEDGVEPNKPYKGSFNVRISSDLHRASAVKAMQVGTSLNQVVERALNEYVHNYNNFIKSDFRDDKLLNALSKVQTQMSLLTTKLWANEESIDVSILENLLINRGNRNEF